jgi:hypothetical protein
VTPVLGGGHVSYFDLYGRFRILSRQPCDILNDSSHKNLHSDIG